MGFGHPDNKAFLKEFMLVRALHKIAATDRGGWKRSFQFGNSHGTELRSVRGYAFSKNN